MSGWPYPGDAPVSRARKIALAYRALAETQAEKARELEQLLAEINGKLLKWDDPKRSGKIKALLADLTRDDVTDLDLRFLHWGETWHTPLERTQYDEDDWVTSREAGKILSLDGNSVLMLRRRGRIKGRWVKGTNPHFEFRVGDLWKLQTERRTRKGQPLENGDATDNLSTSETGD